jgi:hypothetical protein
VLHRFFAVMVAYSRMVLSGMSSGKKSSGERRQGTSGASWSTYEEVVELVSVVEHRINLTKERNENGERF